MLKTSNNRLDRFYRINTHLKNVAFILLFLVGCLCVYGMGNIIEQSNLKPTTSLSQRVTEKFAPEHVTCIATGVLLYDGDITKEGVQSSDNKIGFHDLKTGRGVVIENPFCITTIPPDKYPELVPNKPKPEVKDKNGEVKANGPYKQG